MPEIEVIEFDVDEAKKAEFRLDFLEVDDLSDIVDDFDAEAYEPCEPIDPEYDPYKMLAAYFPAESEIRAMLQN